MRQKLSKKGFTLIELLVVISIISFLASSTMVLVKVTQIKARNVKRNGDIVQLIKAFQLALDNSGGEFPDIDYSACLSTICGCSGDEPEMNVFIGPYIQKPVFPNPDGVGCYGYQYYIKPSGIPYFLWEIERGSNIDCGPGINTPVGSYVCEFLLD